MRSSEKFSDQSLTTTRRTVRIRSASPPPHAIRPPCHPAAPPVRMPRTQRQMQTALQRRAIDLARPTTRSASNRLSNHWPGAWKSTQPTHDQGGRGRRGEARPHLLLHHQPWHPYPGIARVWRDDPVRQGCRVQQLDSLRILGPVRKRGHALHPTVAFGGGWLGSHRPDEWVMRHGHWMKPCAQRHPPQAGSEFPKQSSWFPSAFSHELQAVQGEKSKSSSRTPAGLHSRARPRARSGCCSRSEPTA